jgi:hypothetical protein
MCRANEVRLGISDQAEGSPPSQNQAQLLADWCGLNNSDGLTTPAIHFKKAQMSCLKYQYRTHIALHIDELDGLSTDFEKVMKQLRELGTPVRLLKERKRLLRDESLDQLTGRVPKQGRQQSRKLILCNLTRFVQAHNGVLIGMIPQT